MGKLAFNRLLNIQKCLLEIADLQCGLLRSKRFTLADLADAEQTNSIFVADLRFAEQKKYLRLPALDFTIMHVKSCGNICMLASNLPLSDKMYWACFMTEQMQLCNISDQRRKRSVTLNYYVLAWRSSTNHSTQQSALTQKYWQNTAIGLVEWTIGFTRSLNNWFLNNRFKQLALWPRRSWQFQLIGSTFAVTFEREKVPFSPLVTRLCNSGWSPCGRGGDADRVKFNMSPILIFVTQDRTQIASKRNFVTNRYLSKSKDVSLTNSPS